MPTMQRPPVRPLDLAASRGKRVLVHAEDNAIEQVRFPDKGGELS
ncbi:hypothetical protein [Dokdonella sp.]|jgi:hypothetical protein|nr:hypothetical protein [Dokdonella sp.]